MVELLFLPLTAMDQFLLSQLFSPSSRRNTIGNVCTYVLNNEARVRNHCCHRKTISITHSECVSVALVTLHAMHMFHIFVLACLALPYFSILYHKRQFLGESC